MLNTLGSGTTFQALWTKLNKTLQQMKYVCYKDLLQVILSSLSLLRGLYDQVLSSQTGSMPQLRAGIKYTLHNEFCPSEDILSAPVIIVVIISRQLFVVIIDPHPPKQEQSRSLFPQQLQPSNQSLFLSEASLSRSHPTLPLLALPLDHQHLAPPLTTPLHRLLPSMLLSCLL